MKHSKTYQKGKHIYIKTGNIKEVITPQPDKKLDIEFEENYEEIYIDKFQFKIHDKKVKIFFSKEIPGLNKTNLKRVINMDIKTAKDFIRLLKKELKEEVQS